MELVHTQLLYSILNTSILYLGYVIPLLLSIAIITLLERRTMGSIQRRRGPSSVGILGGLQPIADGVKLLRKELFATSNSSAWIFMAAPILSLVLMLVAWSLIPLSSTFALLELQYSMLLILIIGSLNVHTIIFAGWSSNSKYAFLGGVRAASQMISYEICLGTIFASVIMMCGSFSLVDVVYSQVSVWFILPLFPMWLLFVVTSLAETNRTPFDLVEAEAELVAGYNVEYSAMPFAMLFIAEYGNIMFMSALSTIFFFGGWLLPFCNTLDESVLNEYVSPITSSVVFAIKTSINVFIFIPVRATVPRYRYDQLMNIGWKILIPISLSVLIVQCRVLTYFTTTGTDIAI